MRLTSAARTSRGPLLPWLFPDPIMVRPVLIRGTNLFVSFDNDEARAVQVMIDRDEIRMGRPPMEKDAACAAG
jgi:hypothetical protein